MPTFLHLLPNSLTLQAGLNHGMNGSAPLVGEESRLTDQYEFCDA